MLTILTLIPTLSPLGLFAILLIVVLFVLVVGLCWWGINKLSAAFGIGEPVKSIIVVVFVFICVGALIWFLLTNFPTMR